MKNKIDYDQIDVGFRDIIRILNDKGYKTIFCCEGHTDKLESRRDRWNAYLMFNFPYEFSEPIPLYDLDRAKNYNKAYSKISNPKGQTAYYWFGERNSSIEDKEQKRQNLMGELLHWANSLKVQNFHFERAHMVQKVNFKCGADSETAQTFKLMCDTHPHDPINNRRIEDNFGLIMKEQR